VDGEVIKTLVLCLLIVLGAVVPGVIGATGGRVSLLAVAGFYVATLSHAFATGAHIDSVIVDVACRMGVGVAFVGTVVCLVVMRPTLETG
jgi:hypothetical protein